MANDNDFEEQDTQAPVPALYEPLINVSCSDLGHSRLHISPQENISAAELHQTIWSPPMSITQSIHLITSGIAKININLFCLESAIGHGFREQPHISAH